MKNIDLVARIIRECIKSRLFTVKSLDVAEWIKEDMSASLLKDIAAWSFLYCHIEIEARLKLVRDAFTFKIEGEACYEQCGSLYWDTQADLYIGDIARNKDIHAVIYNGNGDLLFDSAIDDSYYFEDKIGSAEGDLSLDKIINFDDKIVQERLKSFTDRCDDIFAGAESFASLSA